MIRIFINSTLIRETISELKSSPNREKVLFWSGKLTEQGYLVYKVVIPLQETGKGYFIIPEKGISSIINGLKEDKSMLIAQIHTHPGSAFHSIIDDRECIMRHENAYSIVIPHFCQYTDDTSFKENMAIFKLSKANKWEETSKDNLIIIE